MENKAYLLQVMLDGMYSYTLIENVGIFKNKKSLEKYKKKNTLKKHLHQYYNTIALDYHE